MTRMMILSWKTLRFSEGACSSGRVSGSDTSMTSHKGSIESVRSALPVIVSCCPVSHTVIAQAAGCRNMCNGRRFTFIMQIGHLWNP